jgi:hypothetical protein
MGEIFATRPLLRLSLGSVPVPINIQPLERFLGRVGKPHGLKRAPLFYDGFPEDLPPAERDLAPGRTAREPFRSLKDGGKE